MRPPSTLTKASWPPDYVSIFQWRQAQLERINSDPKIMYGAIEYYSENLVDFINHWCDTFDPRNALIDLPTWLPFNMFSRQEELALFILDCVREQENGLVDKSREMGATWIGVAVSVWLWRYYEGAAIGWGSRKQDLVDKLSDPDSIFEKIRLLIYRLPRFFWPLNFDPINHMSFMRIVNPQNDAIITGEAGDNIGRGGRKLVYFKDESAHYEHPESIEAALGDNTRTQIDISTPCGVGTVFDRRREGGQLWVPGEKIKTGVTRVFVLDWSDHPAKDQTWHDRRESQMRNDGLLHIFRQEVDRDPAASIEGIIIPGEWVRSAIDAHVKLALPDEGMWSGALDVADEGGDLNALTLRKGIVLRYADDWGEGDTGKTARRAINVCSSRCPINIQFDATGVGAGIKAEANRQKQEQTLPRGMEFIAWHGGAKVLKPDEPIIKGDSKVPLNKDFYGNLKAQASWALRRRFELTHKAVTEKGFKYNASDLISIDSKIPKLRAIQRELSQPVMTHDGSWRLIIDKKPDGARSPNLFDSIVMNYFPLLAPMKIPQKALEWSAQR